MKSSLEEMLGTIHLPQKVFGNSALELIHEDTGFKIFFNALDALRRWRQECLLLLRFLLPRSGSFARTVSSLFVVHHFFKGLLISCCHYLDMIWSVNPFLVIAALVVTNQLPWFYMVIINM